MSERTCRTCKHNHPGLRFPEGWRDIPAWGTCMHPALGNSIEGVSFTVRSMPLTATCDLHDPVSTPR